jgi:hypothetical protein
MSLCRSSNRLDWAGDLGHSHLAQAGYSFDDLICAGEDCWWDRQVQQTGRFQVDVQLVSRGLLDGNIGRSDPFYDLIDLRSGLTSD